ncbi:hypothetical protein DL765_006743 [Monosporascus sp. GIB2]|nr:hypothetical protein DL765_006743 [Monosporascus sp. GIB2]
MHFLHPLFLAPVALARPWAMPQEVTKPPPAMDGGKGEAAPPQQPAMTGRVIPVVVGGQQVVFVPNVVKASVGDVVQFQFSAGNHTVTQSSADAACVPLQSGVHSGHIPFEAGQATVGVFEMPVVSTDTMFLYCATGPHCQLGQIMVINPTDDQQVVNYAKLAQAAPENIDGTEVVGGTVSEIPLEQAAFDPPPPEQGEAPPPPGGAPPAEGETPAKGEAPPTELPPAGEPATPEKPPAKNPGIVIVPLPSSTGAPAATETTATETAATGTVATETAATETAATETAATETAATETAAAGEPAITTVFVTVTAAAATATA